MTFRPAIWHPIALALSGLNLVGAGFAAALAEPWHAAAHAGLAGAFWLWSQRLRQAPRDLRPQEQLELLEAEVSILRQELSETQERLDFAERLLARDPSPRGLESER